MDSIKLQDHVLIQLIDGDCFVGVLIFVNSAGTRFELDNVRNWLTNETFQSPQFFYRRDVRTVQHLPSDTTSATPAVKADDAVSLKAQSKRIDIFTNIDHNGNDSSIPSPSANPSITPSSLSFSQLTDVPLPPSRLSVNELQRIRASIATAAYYPHKDRGFYAAVEALRIQETVALSICYVYRATRSCVGLVSAITAHDGRVHHFDIQSLGMPDVLRQLLSAERPLKIIHDCSLATYALHVQHDVQLNGVFDTRLAHAAIGGNGAAVNLGDMVELYLRIPSVTCGSRKSGDSVDWTLRPLSADVRQLAGERVAYLPALYGHLLYGRMLAAFLGSCKQFSNVYTFDKDEIDVACRVHMTGGIESTDNADSMVERLPVTLTANQMPMLPCLDELRL